MPINNESLNKRLFELLKTQGLDPQPKDSTGKSTPVPDEADVFKFSFKKEDDENPESAWITIENGTIQVYYDDDIMDEAGNFTKFLQQLKSWAQRKQLSFATKNQDHLAYDMAQREHMKKKEQVNEGYYPMGKSASYNDSIPTVKIVLQHSRQIQEGEQRYRNVARIYLENVQGERILAPTVRPGIAQVYARHLAEGGVPNDDRWNHIKSLCEEYSKMAGFVRAVRGNQFNESAQRLVEAGLNHYQGLRESLGKMRGHRGYTAYFESWTPTLMENEGDETNLNELFVQETLDPRIESVMPILNRLKVNLGEMKEVDELAEWADKILESPGAETLAHNQSTEEKRLQALDLDEADDAEAAHKKINTPAVFRKGDKVTLQDLEKAKERNISGKEGMAALTKRLQDIGQLEEEEVEESGLQAYLGNKKYGKEGMEELQRLGREHASKEKVAKAKAKFAKEDVEGVAEGLDPEKRARLDDLIDEYRDATDPSDYASYLEPEEIINDIRKEFGDKIADQVEAGADKMHFGHHDNLQRNDPMQWKKPVSRVTKAGKMYQQDMDYKKRDIKSRLGIDEEVEEGLDANQKRVGQLGPTTPVGKNEKNLRGMAVGASESFINTDAQAVVTEMDKSQPSSDRGGESSGNPYAKGGTATPIKAARAKKDFLGVLQRSVANHNKAKQDTDKKVAQHQVKEGQEDFDSLMRLLGK